MDNIPDQYQPQHDMYIKKSAQMLKEYDIRVHKDDWKELLFDNKLFMKSWIRNTELGHKSMKVELIIEG